MVANLSYLPPLATFVYNSMCYVTQSSYNVSDNIQYNVGAANIDMMKEALGNIDWESILDLLDSIMMLDYSWLFLKCIMQDLIDKHFPTYRPKERKHLYTTSEVFTLKKKKNKLWEKYCSTHSPKVN